MPNYEPISRQDHLDRGYCCQMGCIYCPYRPPVVFEKTIIDLRIEAALRSGETVRIFSNRFSLVPIVLLANRVEIVYKNWADRLHYYD
jgi:Family of unknown function (DUF5522)